MKIVKTDDFYRVFDDSLTVIGRLPPGAYIILFNKMTGYGLEAYDLQAVEEKVYGNHAAKADKVLGTFAGFERNMGVILSGEKGIGKSLFTRILADKAKERGMPTIVVRENTPGLVRFIESIDQEAVFLFDEFEKNFKNGNGDDEKGPSPQETMLSMFDGISGGKKLFVVTCNKWGSLNDCMLNRPGRFHYHFRFRSPSIEEIEEYLADNIKPEYAAIIPDAVGFAARIGLNYDCLRALVTELNNGYSIEESAEDLNIIAADSEAYDIFLRLNDGSVLSGSRYWLCLTDRDASNLWFGAYRRTNIPGANSLPNIVNVTFSPINIRVDRKTGDLFIPADKILQLTYRENMEQKEALEYVKKVGVNRMIFRHAVENIHYSTADPDTAPDEYTTPGDDYSF